MLLAYLITLAVPLVILFILYSYDTFGLQPKQIIVLALLWGGVAYGLAYFLELLVTGIVSYGMLVLVAAPIIEETLKAALIGYLLARGRLVNMVDGMSIGFEIGLSFGVVENLIYLSQFTGTTTEAIGFAAARVLTAGLMHAFVMGMVGAVAGHSVRYRRRRQRLYFYGAVSLAVLLHFAYNLVSLSFNGVWLLLGAMAIGILGAGVMFVLFQREMNWVNKRVRLLGGQTSAATQWVAANPQTLHAALERYEAELGREFVARIERYAHLLAQRSVLQAALDDYGATRHRDVIHMRLEEAEGQIAVLNADVGVFTRVWMGTLIANDPQLLSALQGTPLSTDDDPLLAMALMLAGRTGKLTAPEIEARKLALTSSSVFGMLSGADLEDVALMLDARYCTRGETVLQRGSPNSQAFLVAVGMFELSMAGPDGETVVMGQAAPGEVFGLASALGDQQVTSDVVCVREGLLFALSENALLSLIYGNPRIGLMLTRHLASRLQHWGALMGKMTELLPERS